MNTIIVQGSSRSDGNTHQIAKILARSFEAEIIDLKIGTINSYSYEHDNADDDFLPIMRKIIDYDTIIFITPVYWYSMSGIMKNFFDRISDCLKTEKDLGRKLRGKNMMAIACGSDEVEVEGFFVPFKNSAEYLGMNYLGDIHTWIENKMPGEEVLRRLEIFANEIKNSQAADNEQ
jgi:multimeric flavodoxin WrbA